MNYKTELIKRACKKDFWFFLYYVDGDFWKVREPYIKELCDIISDYWNATEPNPLYDNGEYEKMNVELAAFPRFAKSFLSQRLKDWLILRNDTIQIMSISATDSLSKKLHIKLRSDFETNNKIINLFDYTVLTANAKEFSLRSGVVNALATSIGGQATGNGANVIIIDDAYKDHAQALSQVQNEAVIDFYNSAIKNRFEGKKRMEIHIGTRWTTKELTATLLDRNFFHHVIKVPALQNNKSIIPSIISTDELLTFRQEDPITFLSTYQQEPNDVKGALFKKEELKFINKYERASDLSFIMIDPSDEGEDYMCAAFSCKNKVSNKYVIADFLHTQDNIDTYEERLKEFILNNNPSIVFVEDNMDKTFAKQIVTFCAINNIGAINFRTTKNKHVKILSNTGRIKTFEFLKNQSHEYNSAIEQLTSYERDGTSKHDDAPDVLAMLVEKINDYDPMYFTNVIKEEVKNAR